MTSWISRSYDSPFEESDAGSQQSCLGVFDGFLKVLAEAPVAHVVEPGVLGAQTGLDVAQALAVAELAKGHAQVLIETGKTLNLVMATIALDTTPEGMKGKVVRQLYNYDLARVHKPFLD